MEWRTINADHDLYSTQHHSRHRRRMSKLYSTSPGARRAGDLVRNLLLGPVTLPYAALANPKASLRQIASTSRWHQNPCADLSFLPISHAEALPYLLTLRTRLPTLDLGLQTRPTSTRRSAGPRPPDQEHLHPANERHASQVYRCGSKNSVPAKLQRKLGEVVRRLY